MSTSTITVSYPEHHIAWCQLNRPHKRNAMNLEMIRELRHALSELGDARALVLAAEGNTFSAGADLKWMQESIRYSESENVNDALELAELIKQLYELSIPTIALVQGACYGGANGLVAACDFAVATPDAKFCFSEVKLGLIPAVISPFVINAIGHRMARQYFLSAEVFTATEAKQAQLITHCDKDLSATGLRLAKQVMKNQPQALKHCKSLLADFAPVTINSAIMNDLAKCIASLRSGEEAQACLKKFLKVSE